MKHRFGAILGAMAAALMVSSCATQEIISGDEPLVIRVMPQGSWVTSKVYLNDQYVDTAAVGSDQRVFKVAPGRYKIRLVTDNHELCDEQVTIVGGMGGRNYFEFHPKLMKK